MNRLGFLAALLLVWTVALAQSDGERANKTAPSTVGVPKLGGNPTVGTWRFKDTTVQPDGTYLSTYSITIKDNGDAWAVTTTWETPDGSVTDLSTLEKDTLILRKELFKHFPKAGKPWKPVTINLDLTGNRVTGTITNAGGQDKPVSLDLSGPFFGRAAFAVTMGCLPLAIGYSTTVRTLDIVNQRANLLKLKVVGTERVAVPAGAFDSWKVELTSVDGGSYKETAWIARELRMELKTFSVESYGKSSSSTTTELVRNATD